MATWSDLAEAANGSLFAVFGEVATYSRPGGATLNAVAEFAVSVGQDSRPELVAAEAAGIVVLVRTADIPLGPQRGDQLVWRGDRYVVLSISDIAVDGISRIAVRKLK